MLCETAICNLIAVANVIIIILASAVLVSGFHLVCYYQNTRENFKL
jgi:hypothetical protein